MRDYRRQFNLNMPIAMDDGSLGAALNLRVTPQHVVVGRDGRILYVGHLDDDRLDAALRASRRPSARRHRFGGRCRRPGKSLLIQRWRAPPEFRSPGPSATASRVSWSFSPPRAENHYCPETPAGPFGRTCCRRTRMDVGRLRRYSRRALARHRFGIVDFGQGFQ